MTRRLKIAIATTCRLQVLDLPRELHALGHDVKYSYMFGTRASSVFVFQKKGGFIFMNNLQTIDIAVAGKFHAYRLASEYAAITRLRGLYSAHISVNVPNNLSYRKFHNRIDLAIWGELSRFISLGYTDARKLELFDNWIATNLINKAPAILHSWNGNSRNTFAKLKGLGWRLCVERSCPHNRFQYELLSEEGKALGVPHVQNMHLLDRAIEELYLADVIVAPSSYSASTYKEPELI